jgi:hypothetical protein
MALGEKAAEKGFQRSGGEGGIRSRLIQNALSFPTTL